MSGDKIAYQGEFCPAVPPIRRNAQFKEYRRQLERMDQIIRSTGADLKLAASYVRHMGKYRKKEPSARQRKKDTCYSVQGLRCNILRHYLGVSFVELSCRIAESQLLQGFIGASAIDGTAKVPGKSLLFDYSKMLPAEELELFIAVVTSSVIGDHGIAGLEEPVKADDVFADACCLEADIHFPVDWLMLRDETRTVMKSIKTIRRHGLFHRMRSPEKIMTEMNHLCMAMTGSRRKKHSEKERKKVFRRMKKLEKVVRAHGWRYCGMLEGRWRETDLEEDEALKIMRRMRNVLEQAPFVVRQAHERIIGGRHVENSKKILSIYDPDVDVVVRGKADAEVEFGNVLYLAEQEDGLIVDHRLYRRSAPGDTAKLDESLERMKASGIDVKRFTADRGFDAERTRKSLDLENIYNAICPKDPAELERRSGSVLFKKLQKRRAQTEGRISIVRNGFIGNPAKGRSFGKRRTDVAWAVFSHNLWVLARLPEAKEEELLKAG